MPQNKKGFIPPHGGYKNLLSYQKSQIVFDGTAYFTQRWLPRFDRTIDQMVQAARSGKQNIIEGSSASGHSKKSEIMLTGVARASLEELLEDYRDFLRLRGEEEWPIDHPHTQRMRELNRKEEGSYDTFKKGIENDDPVIAANVLIGLIKLTNYLLDQQIRHLEQAFIQEGGLSERMTRARIDERNREKRR